MTSTYADVYFKASIKDGAGNPTEPPEDVYAQLTSLIESGILKGDDGLTPYVGSNNNWWIGDIDTGVLARGTDGEDGYTPVKGMDYFTEEEIQQIQNEVSGGAIGDFKAVVDEETATFNTNAENTLTDYNANAQEKFDTYNTNADSKFETYNTNAETKFSGYNTNAEAKLSEYNKNDLDKTTSYNTNADSKFTKYNTNAEAKFSEYTNNADTKLAEYNQNDSDKTDLYNTNAESKLGAYDSNAQAKLDLYNQNDSEKTEAYDSNAQTKLAAYDANAADKLSTYNNNAAEKLAKYNANASEKLTNYDTNAEQHTTEYNANAEVKLEAYNQNHAAKVAEYNQNAETKTAEFDSNAAALQTEVDRLRGECDQLAEENRKQENRISALLKLNKGQTYDILPEEGESASRTAPSGAKYVSVDKVGGKSVVWNQLVCSEAIGSGGTLDIDGGIYTLTPNISSGFSEVQFSNNTPYTRKSGHKYYASIDVKSDAWASSDNSAFCTYDNLWLKNYMTRVDTSTHSWQKLKGIFVSRQDANAYGNFCFRKYHEETNSPVSVKNAMVFDLTRMFGAGNEPSTVEEFEEMFPDDYYEYCEPTIISSQTDRVDVASADGTITQQITTGFPVLNSAGSVHDYIDLNEGKHRQRVGVVDLGTIDWEQGGYNNKTSWVPISWRTNVKPVQYTNDKANILCNKYCTDTADNVEKQVNDKTISVNRNSWVYIYDSAYISVTPQEFKEAMSGVMLYYELAEEIITDIEIPTELSDWLTVEAGGSVTFHNADETKQLAVPNAVSWVRKLDEVN